MTAVEVVELGGGNEIVLAYEPVDPLAGAEIVSVSQVQLPPGSGVPIGPAGGVLSGSYPNPGFAEAIATEAHVESTVDSRVATHRNAPQPHPAYDDLPSLSLLLESRLV